MPSSKYRELRDEGIYNRSAESSSANSKAFTIVISLLPLFISLLGVYSTLNSRIAITENEISHMRENLSSLSKDKEDAISKLNVLKEDMADLRVVFRNTTLTIERRLMQLENEINSEKRNKK